MTLKWNSLSGIVTSGRAAKVLVVGGRDVSQDEVFECLDHLVSVLPIASLVSGNKKGAEAEAKRWARKNGVKYLSTTADWGRFGERAELLRDQRVFTKLHPDIDVIVKFPGLVSKAICEQTECGLPTLDSAILRKTASKEYHEPPSTIESGV